MTCLHIRRSTCWPLRVRRTPSSCTSRTPEKPFRIDALTDTNNVQGRHTAAFSNDGKTLVQTDEWGGGTGPICQASSMIELGGNTVLSLDAKKKQTQRASFKRPSAQTAEETASRITLRSGAKAVKNQL